MNDVPFTAQECPVCLTAVVGSLVSWVLFPCNHGVCARCFELLVESQARTALSVWLQEGRCPFFPTCVVGESESVTFYNDENKGS